MPEDISGATNINEQVLQVEPEVVSDEENVSFIDYKKITWH